MFATIWMCTQEWSLIARRLTAFTLATCHQPLSCSSVLTRSSSVVSLRLARVGTRMRICATASLGVSRVSRSACSETGSSMRSCVSLSSSATCLLRGKRDLRLLARTQFVVRHGPCQGDERSEDSPRDAFRDDGPCPVGQPIQNRSDSRAHAEEDQNRQDYHAEHAHPWPRTNSLLRPSELMIPRRSSMIGIMRIQRTTSHRKRTSRVRPGTIKIASPTRIAARPARTRSLRMEAN